MFLYFYSLELDEEEKSLEMVNGEVDHLDNAFDVELNSMGDNEDQGT